MKEVSHSRTFESVRCFKPTREDVMDDGVEGSGQIEEGEQCKVTSVESCDDIGGNL